MQNRNRLPLSPILATSPFRGLKPVEKAMKLVEDKLSSERASAEACGVSRSSLKRAIAAKENCRPVGVNGRPHIFTPDQERRYGERVIQLNAEGIKMTVQKCQDLVGTFFSSSFSRCM